jgi:hypothetical protein
MVPPVLHQDIWNDRDVLPQASADLVASLRPERYGNVRVDAMHGTVGSASVLRGMSSSMDLLQDAKCNARRVTFQDQEDASVQLQPTSSLTGFSAHLMDNTRRPQREPPLLSTNDYHVANAETSNTVRVTTPLAVIETTVEDRDFKPKKRRVCFADDT